MRSLTADQKRDVCLILSIGCARETAERYAGCSAEQINAAALEDARFARDLARAEAGVELAHMRAVQQAARDERHWRASAWWLERCMPEQYARRHPDALTPSELKNLMKKLCDAISDEVTSPADRQRLLRRLTEAADEVEPGERTPPGENDNQQESDP